MSEEYKKLNPKAKSSMYVKNIVLLVIVVCVAIAVSCFILEFEDSDAIFYLAAIIAVAGIITAYLVIGPIVFYRHYQYIIDQDKIDVKRGIIILTHTVVPIERVHQVQVERGPINNLFGLADVIVTTAGGVATIQYLEADVAETIVQELNDIINNIVRGRNEDA